VFLDSYTGMRTLIVPPHARKVRVQDKAGLACRYCHRSPPDVTFRAEAHAAPELLGVGALVSPDECDTCNELFSRTLDDSLGKYLGASRTLSQLRGKGGVPAYKAKDGSLVIRLGAEGLQVRSAENAGLVQVDSAAGTIRFQYERQPYIPVCVYKAFVKMAVAIMPEHELAAFQDTISWLLEPPESQTAAFFSPLALLVGFVPGQLPTPGAIFMVLRRTGRADELPYCVFIAAFGNFIFELVVPSRQHDAALAGKDLILPTFPTPFDQGSEKGPPAWRAIDCSGTTPVQGKKASLVLQCDEIVEAPVEPEVPGEP
jgi:hypothetical protein